MFMCITEKPKGEVASTSVSVKGACLSLRVYACSAVALLLQRWQGADTLAK